MNCRYVLDKIAGLRKKQALTVVYENCHIIERYERTLSNVSHKPFYKRKQSEYEESCATDATRVFSTYTYFFNMYQNQEELINAVIEDDKVLIEDKVEAEVMKQAFFQAIEQCYGTNNLHFSTKIKRNKKINNQPTLFEYETLGNTENSHTEKQM